eukprot:CAMPEP_0172571198 /NCGR_PEP_ID=MMETSP1067-20121228/130454_1 /TAXON_ID=265564 ORGANISM="Thalassiosira punctigera, Strain Tpunct2005C2" /NCGR_SAMPLE_ID=MMETSP1067 /ASSEMBLY_ACC=CAM_ASM_000444 /LENGTH=93 /DNA_ID=CAMNT_0013363465 /DNA_START=37 /DNA_END=314 /DNA_ORIENTATION=-
MSKRNWCDTCRGDGSKHDELLRCASCPRRFHKECAGLRISPGDGWACPHCVADEENDHGKKKGENAVEKRIAAVRKCHKELASHSRDFLSERR